MGTDATRVKNHPCNRTHRIGYHVDIRYLYPNYHFLLFHQDTTAMAAPKLDAQIGLSRAHRRTHFLGPLSSSRLVQEPAAGDFLSLTVAMSFRTILSSEMQSSASELQALCLLGPTSACAATQPLVRVGNHDPKLQLPEPPSLTSSAARCRLQEVVV
jgi:hypothetical protein